MKKLLSVSSLGLLAFLAQVTVDLDGNFAFSTGDITPWKEMLGNIVSSAFSLVTVQGAWIVGGVIMLALLARGASKIFGHH